MKQKLGLIFLHYIRLLAKLQLAKLNLVRQILGKKKIRIVGIAGSAGKTSTMLASVAALEGDYQVKYSKKANTESGIPLNILGIRMESFQVQDWLKTAFLSMIKILINWENYDVYIVEMGIDEPEPPGNMGYLLRIIKPTIGVFTNVTSVHAMEFEKGLEKKSITAVLERIADEKAKLISALPEKGFAIMNFDDPLVKERKKLTLGQVIGVGEDEKSKIKLIDYQVNLKGTKFIYQVSEKKYDLHLDSFILPKVYGINFGLALGIGMSLDLDLEGTINKIKANFKLPPGRSTLIKGIKNSYLIDSSYNASPSAMKTMLDLLDKLGKKTKRKKIAILGDMRELGGLSKPEHEKLAEKAAAAADQIITVGPEMEKYFVPKVSTFVHDRELKLTVYSTAGEAAEYLKENLTGGELILVKGSQNTIFLEIVVKALMADPSESENVLCRQSEYWEEKRRNFT